MANRGQYLTTWECIGPPMHVRVLFFCVYHELMADHIVCTTKKFALDSQTWETKVKTEQSH